MERQTRQVVIVGGGTAGWLTAARLSAELGDRKVSISLVESPDVPTIGVGEGTWPTMRSTLQAVGISEAELLRRADASFKQGTRFRGWRTGDDDTYLHPFSIPAEYSTLNLAPVWLQQPEAAQRSAGRSQSFAAFVSPQAAVIDAGLAPKQASTPEYAFNVNYAYHFDAGAFAEMLREHAVRRLGVQHVVANVTGVDRAECGDIAGLQLDRADRLAGDLFIDCSGQHSLLLGQALGVGLEPVGRYLFNDAAIAVQVPYRQPGDAIPSVTLATARDAGWIWDIGLQSRRGVGYVYSSSHCDADTAEATLREYAAAIGGADVAAGLDYRRIPFTAGYRRRFWERNCLAVGLSAGFVEPLEASAIALIEQAATMLCRQFPVNRATMDVVARRFNERMAYNWQRVVEFLKLHYVLTQRGDSAYWRDNRDPATSPDELNDKLLLWQQQAPWHDDAPRIDELFPSASYQYVLYGMGFRPAHLPRPGAGQNALRRIDGVLHANNEKARQLTALLPRNRELLDGLTATGGIAECG